MKAPESGERNILTTEKIEVKFEEEIEVDVARKSYNLQARQLINSRLRTLKTMKPLLLAVIYGVSLFFLVWSALILFEEERIEQIEYIDEVEYIEPKVYELLNDSIFKNSGSSIFVIYFVEPVICPPCMTEISEFSRLMISEKGLSLENQFLVINTMLSEEAQMLERSLNLKINYSFAVESDMYHFLSSYGLRELVGQMIVIDKDHRRVLSRVILEKSMPTEMQVKKDFLHEIM